MHLHITHFARRPLLNRTAFLKSGRLSKRVHSDRLDVFRCSCQFSSIRTIQEDIKNKKRSILSITEEYVRNIEKTSGLQSFLTTDVENARRTAAEMDKQFVQGGPSSLGPLAGVPIAVKDNICTEGLQTTAGSQILTGNLHIPAACRCT